MSQQTRDRRPVPAGPKSKTIFVAFNAFAIFIGGQALPVDVSQSQSYYQGLPGVLYIRGGGELNPVKAKYPTRPDPGMGYPNLNVLAENKTSRYDDETWSITETVFHPGMFYSRIPLANGYFGTTVSAAGPFFEGDINQTNINGKIPIAGWPVDETRQTFSTVSGFYDCQPQTARTHFGWFRNRGCEPGISGVPHPMSIYLSIGNVTLDANVDKNTISDFEQTMSFKDGTVSWRYT